MLKKLINRILGSLFGYFIIHARHKDYGFNRVLKILISNSQISPLSGSIKEQNVNLLKKEIIELYGKNYEVLHFKLKSKN